MGYLVGCRLSKKLIEPNWQYFLYRNKPDYSNFIMNNDQSLAQHFQKYFRVLRADTDELKKQVYKIRYEVYCTELQYEKNCLVDCEKDNFDDYSDLVLVQHKASGLYAGCVRLVNPPAHNCQAQLPFEVFCLGSVEPEKIKFLYDTGRSCLGEMSRLAVLASFRRRAGEKANHYGFNENATLNVQFCEEETRFFPFIAVALYFGSAAIAIAKGLNYAVVMMEPRLARHLARFGICFIQLGEVIEYHGERAMFYIDYPTLFDNLKPEFELFYRFVEEQLTK